MRDQISSHRQSHSNLHCSSKAHMRNTPPVSHGKKGARLDRLWSCNIVDAILIIDMLIRRVTTVTWFAELRHTMLTYGKLPRHAATWEWRFQRQSLVGCDRPLPLINQYNIISLW